MGRNDFYMYGNNVVVVAEINFKGVITALYKIRKRRCV